MEMSNWSSPLPSSANNKKKNASLEQLSYKPCEEIRWCNYAAFLCSCTNLIPHVEAYHILRAKSAVPRICWCSSMVQGWLLLVFFFNRWSSLPATAKTPMLMSAYSTKKRYLCQPGFVHWNLWLEVWLFFFVLLVGIVKLQKHWELI